ncbi:MAG: hypothetical protein JWO78_2182 [Micavibrio sp.]|nr:hypothetical protein [Micavibrio sp.]
MELRTDAVQQACRDVSRQMRDYTRNLGLSFIVHHAGQHLEAMTLAGQELLSHPGADPALRLLKTATYHENSAFLGLCVWRENVLFGLASRQAIMALMTINSDEFEHLRDVRSQAWMMAWHALNLASLRHKPEFNSLFADGVITGDMPPEELALANLKADVFAAAMCAMNGDKGAINLLAQRRSNQALERRPAFKPEHFPFAITMEATNFAYNEMMMNPPPRKKQINAALQLAENVALAYDSLSVRQWMNFCKPAQDMAWRGDAKETIIGAAVSTSQDTYIRATGFLVSEATGIKPASILTLENIYTPFAEAKYNQRLHNSMMERAFERAVNAGMANFDGSVFSDIANEQNAKLSNGHILGWCAGALQAAGRAFEGAIMRGSKSPDQDARREFDGNNGKTTWDALCDLGETIIDHYRSGYASTFSDLIEFCGDRPALVGVSSSIAFTMKDPSYLKKLDIANDLHSGPSPDMQPANPAPKAPGYFNAPKLSIPGFGLGSSGSSREIPKTRTVRTEETTDT